MIDAHVHLWQLGRHGCTWPDEQLPAIHRDYVLADAKAAAAPLGVSGAVLVQSQEDPADTAWLLDLAADPFMVGVVGWADLTRPDTIPAHSALKGLRPMVQDREDDWYDAPARAAGLSAMAGAGLTLDALVRPRHLPSLARLAAREPALRIVIDHGAKPELATGNLHGWTDAIRAAARRGNVLCKLSGLLTELAPGQDQEAATAAFTVLWHAFGSERLIWGSDWPVLTLAGDYARWLDMARSLVPGHAHPAVFGGNAARAYGVTG